jgi:hypothetical protein
MRRYCLTLGGPVPASVLTDVRRRFGVVEVTKAPGRTEVRLRIADQAALRALLDVVWDASVDVVGLAHEPALPADDRATLRSDPGSGP